MKNFTLGKYVPYDSALHRLDALAGVPVYHPLFGEEEQGVAAP